MEKSSNLHEFRKPASVPFAVKWKQASAGKHFKLELSLSLLMQVISLVLLADFLKYTEQREGIALSDPLLQLLDPADLTWIIFGLIYFSLAVAIISFAGNPHRLILALQAYSLLIFVRIAAMYLTPFDAPPGMIPLRDPLIEFFGTGMLLTKDLFFSGHTALLFLLFLTEQRKILKLLFLAASVITGIFLLIQHVHYSIDVFAAPFFAFTVYKSVFKIHTYSGRLKNTANR